MLHYFLDFTLKNLDGDFLEEELGNLNSEPITKKKSHGWYHHFVKDIDKHINVNGCERTTRRYLEQFIEEKIILQKKMPTPSGQSPMIAYYNYRINLAKTFEFLNFEHSKIESVTRLKEILENMRDKLQKVIEILKGSI